MSDLANGSAVKVDYTGRRYGRLLVVGYSHHDARRKSYWRVQCDCGGTKIVGGFNLGRKINSCGCLQQESRGKASVTHGHAKSRTWQIWCQMRQRCGNPNSHAFPRYGGRGITVCAEWLRFEAFLADMGECPDGMSIDRIDNNVGYSKANCRWSSPRTQARNRESSKLIEFRGEALPLAAWAEKLGVKYKTVHARIHRDGWPVERALTTPIRKW